VPVVISIILGGRGGPKLESAGGSGSRDPKQDDAEGGGGGGLETGCTGVNDKDIGAVGLRQR